ncbi:MAG TPA: 16S rRNA (cytosine(1402)-N(4))-methyltransferase RsmH [Nitrospira sp.]|nr:16S rRNA (cytosine(1402)-N(4))-methyltransferase RsmH [Nitrospira sp.]
MAWENVGEIGGRQFGGVREHLPVMPAEVLFWLQPRSRGIYLDCTVGYCGHALDILRASDPNGKVFGIDRDPQAVDAARQRLEPFGDRAVIIKGHFVELKRFLAERSISQVDGVLFDLGASSPQLDDPTRGFSFQSEGPLDMRMDRSGPTAADIVNGLDEIQLADMMYRWGEERYSRRIARALVRARQQGAISTTRQLVSVIESAVPGHYRRGRIHCATRTFQALRIAVNKELDHLEASFRDAADVLAPGGRLCVISFHSLEDRIVKQSFKAFSVRNPGELEVLTKRPQVPTEDETRRNPRSRSAKLRVLQRIVKEGRA